MLATRGMAVPTGAGWTHEVKWDGIRLISQAGAASGPRLWTRNENDATSAWPELVGSAPSRDLLVDGEVIALNEAGVPDFGVLQERMHVRKAAVAQARSVQVPATYLVFDLLRLDGRDLLDQPLARRRELLEALVADGTLTGTWQVPQAHADGAALHRATLEQGLEGIVSKRLGSTYHPGARSRDWLKFPHRQRTSYVVGGWRVEVGARTGPRSRLGALLVGEPTPAGLAYRGRVGSGIAGAQGQALLDLLTPLARASSPFDDEVPRVDAAGTHWVEPILVVDVEALGRSSGDRLRQPSYRGVRPDLTPADLT